MVAPSAYGGPETVSDPLKLELLMTVNHHVDAGSQVQVLWKSSQCSQFQAFSAPWSENFDFFKNPVILYEYVFFLIPGVGYGAASVCPRQLTMIVSCSRRGAIFPAADSLILGTLEKMPGPPESLSEEGGCCCS